MTWLWVLLSLSPVLMMPWISEFVGAIVLLRIHAETPIQWSSEKVIAKHLKKTGVPQSVCFFEWPWSQGTLPRHDHTGALLCEVRYFFFVRWTLRYALNFLVEREMLESRGDEVAGPLLTHTGTLFHKILKTLPDSDLGDDMRILTAELARDNVPHQTEWRRKPSRRGRRRRISEGFSLAQALLR